jgi:P22_AR N-terminal domain
MNADLVPVPVPGTDAPLQAIQVEGRPFVALKPLCDALGIDSYTQSEKLKSRSWACTSLRLVVAADGHRREMTLIDRRTMTMWLATINENKVDERAHDIIIAYQREAADALDAYFNAPRRPTTIDGIRAMLDQIEAAQREASEAKAIAAKTDARLDAIEGKHDWFAALGWARHIGLSDTSNSATSLLGRRASSIAKANGIKPRKTQHEHFGQVNLLPAWVWETAVDQLGLMQVAAE